MTLKFCKYIKLFGKYKYIYIYNIYIYHTQIIYSGYIFARFRLPSTNSAQPSFVRVAFVRCSMPPGLSMAGGSGDVWASEPRQLPTLPFLQRLWQYASCRARRSAWDGQASDDSAEGCAAWMVLPLLCMVFFCLSELSFFRKDMEGFRMAWADEGMMGRFPKLWTPSSKPEYFTLPDGYRPLIQTSSSRQMKLPAFACWWLFPPRRLLPIMWCQVCAWCKLVLSAIADFDFWG